MIKILKNTKKAFTIVELVIVIAVIAVLAAVLIPTFSGVIDKAQRSAALQIARTSLTNVLNMSSTGSLAGDDANGNHQTVFLVNGYAFYYSGNQLNEMDYPSTGSEDKLVYSTDYNAIIIASESANFETYAFSETVNTEITSSTTLNDSIKAIEYEGEYFLTDGTSVCEIYLNSDINPKVVIFTKFSNELTTETKEAVLEKANFDGLVTEESGTGESADFGDLN